MTRIEDHQIWKRHFFIGGYNMKFVFCIGIIGVLETHAVLADPKTPDASSAGPMQVVLVRSAEAGCEPQCPEWISAEGKIEVASVEQFRKVFKSLGQRNVPILIHSPGGRVDAAITIGRMIRQRQMDVAVFRTRFEPCVAASHGCGTVARVNPGTKDVRGHPDTPIAGCASACPIILAGGRHRIVSPWAQVGVHQIRAFETVTKLFRLYRVKKEGSTVIDKSLISEKRTAKVVALNKPPAQMTDKVSRYFRDMGISDVLMTILEATAPSTLHNLSQVELSSTRLATDFVGPEHLIAGGQDANAQGESLRLPGSYVGSEEPLRHRISLDVSMPQRAALVVSTPNEASRTTAYLGIVAWRLESLTDSAGQPLTMNVMADIDIPDAKISSTIVLHNSVAPSGSEHAIDARILQTPDSRVAIRKIGYLLSRNDETKSGLSIASVRTGYDGLRFHFDLPSGDAERRQNQELLKKATWFDLPLLLDGDVLAKITFEKGIPGDKAISLAYAAWQ
jgi:hypothetical protein